MIEDTLPHEAPEYARMPPDGAPADGAAPRVAPFMRQRDDGLLVDLTKLDGSAAFRDAIEQMFVANAYLRGLDYAVFQRLAFDLDAQALGNELQACARAGRPAVLRLAQAVEHFEPARVALYKDPGLSGAEADYLFEPVMLDEHVEEPVCEPDEHGEPQVVRTETRVVKHEARLDVDEFVAQMWLRGVCFGIDMPAVCRAIDCGHRGRLVVARALAPVAGHDAGIQEVAEGLRRDDAPRARADGRIDLAHFCNRFPQIKAGTRLIRKIPIVPGVDGRGVGGSVLEAPVPKDLDLASLAGPGTSVEGEDPDCYLVATIDGFLHIDGQSKCFSVTEKIINREGVSARTTGDLVLMGDEYEEHGEIQERRSVEGKTMTAFADVFGRVVSNGGVITLKKNLSGGAAINRDGPIHVEGLAANAFIHAPAGEVHVGRAEGCVIVGRKVVVGKEAVACEILGDDLEIAVAEGSTLAGKRVAVGIARARGQAETLVSMLLPDLAAVADAIGATLAQLAALDEADAAAREDLERLRSLPDVSNYLLLMGKIRKREVILTAEQKPAFQKLGERIAPSMKALRLLAEQSVARRAERDALHARIAKLEAGRESARTGISCRIAGIEGDVVVRTMTVDAVAPPLTNLPPAELRTRLRAAPQPNSLLFDGAHGMFEWDLAPDDAA